MARLWIFAALACVACGSSNDSPSQPEGEGGSAGSGVQETGGGVSAGGASQAGGSAMAGGSGGSAMSGGAGGSGGSVGASGGSGKAGSGGTPVTNTPCMTTPRWTDVSTAQITQLGGMAAQSYPGGCSGTLVNRLTGDVVIKIIGFGIWKSSDKGMTWARIDQNKIDMGGGRCENGWSMQVDQDNPARMAVFTLDGSAGYTADGTTWKQWTHAPWGRNWDYGSVDWSSTGAQTIIGVEHEKPSQVVTLSTDGGTTWTELTTFDVAGGSAAMVGAIDATTLIGSRGNGIVRSTDKGATWNMVSTVNPLTHVPQRFNNKFYLTTNAGLLVSADQGATWKPQGAAIPGAFMLQGPFFGADENTLVVGTNTTNNMGSGTSSIYKSSDAGAHWTKVSDSPKDFNYVWFGNFTWDPIHDLYYTTRMTQPAFRLDCASQ
jgi:hypothetical protein